MKRLMLLLILLLLCPGRSIAIDFNQTLENHQTENTSDAAANSEAAAPDDTKDERSGNKDQLDFPVKGTVESSLCLRLRAWPWGKIKTLVYPGSKLKVVGESGDFYKVQVNGQTGYMHKNYISVPGAAASLKKPEYPGNCEKGGFLAKKEIPENSNEDDVSPPKKKPAVDKKNQNDRKDKDPAVSNKNPDKNSGNGKTLPRKDSVIGKRLGDGTAAGALTWARDQINGTKNGFNSNNGKTSKNAYTWNGYCLAFVSSAYGRKKSLLSAYSAIKSYDKFKAAGKIQSGKNPPAGAVMFTGTTPGNPYGHIFIATGKMAGPNDPIIITTGWSSWPGIHEIPMSKMGSSARFLGWAVP
ncbi:MAG: SH3 domain-containing protein [Candidatus Rifleibacteriota bacterium]